MTISSFARLVRIVVAAALLAGCNGMQSSSAPGVSQSMADHQYGRTNARYLAMQNPRGIVPHIRLNHHESWMSSAAKRTKYLLYASDAGSGTVDVYAYKSKAGHLLGQLTGFSIPSGECVDTLGNVFVTDNGVGDVVEYAHGGTSPIQTLSDPYGDPVGCSIDPTTGNLAVAAFPSYGSEGSMAIYTGATGSATNVANPNLQNMWSPGYDPSGNLWVEGRNVSGAPGFNELPAGGGSFSSINLSGFSIGFPGGVQWDGFYVALADQGYPSPSSFTEGIYRVTITGGTASLVRATGLTDSCYASSLPYIGSQQPYVTGTTSKLNAVVAGNYDCSNRLDFWNYTNGGNPKRTEPSGIAPLLGGYGQTVSAASSGR